MSGHASQLIKQLRRLLKRCTRGSVQRSRATQYRGFSSIYPTSIDRHLSSLTLPES